MILRKVSDTAVPVSRRHWVVLALASVAGCGGGSSDVAMPGTGGTGIYAQGPIGGFGSVIVNGIRFEDSAARVQIDGSDANEADLRLGMVAGVMGLLNDDKLSGRADQIEIWSIAQGAVTDVSSNGFSVLGMSIVITASTVFEGLMDASAIQAGATLKVWGLQADAAAQRWKATRIESTASALAVATGQVQLRGAGRFLNGIELLGGAVASLRDGELVRVRGVAAASGLTLQVDRVDRLEIRPDPTPGVRVEIEGVVTALLPNARFVLGSVEVDASQLSSAPALQLGDRIEVYGQWRGQVLEASKIEAEGEETRRNTEIEARVEAFTSLADFVVRGQRCDATGAVFKDSRASDLEVGVKVHLKGQREGDRLLVTEIQIAR